jgi:hypothetical protein
MTRAFAVKIASTPRWGGRGVARLLWVNIKDGSVKLGPLINLDAIRESPGLRTEGGSKSIVPGQPVRGHEPAGLSLPAVLRLRSLLARFRSGGIQLPTVALRYKRPAQGGRSAH